MKEKNRQNKLPSGARGAQGAQGARGAPPAQREARAARGAGPGRKIVYAAAAVVAVTFLALSPVLKNGFTNWDDGILLTDNAKVRSLTFGSVKGFFTEFHYALYHPLVTLSYAAEYRFFGYNPRVYHLVNLLLHLANCALVFYLVWLLGGGAPPALPSALVASLLFGVHPLHVESVAWVAERKDVLYAFFFIGSLIYYAEYLKKGAGKYYWLSLAAFVLSVFSKPMAVTLPAVLLLLDYLLKKKITVSDKLLFFAVSLIFSFATYSAQSKLGNISGYTPLHNLLNASSGIVFYIVKTLVPVNLSCLYPSPENMGGVFRYLYYASPFVVGLLAAAVYLSGKYTNKVIFGSAFFAVAILPVIHLIPAGYAVPADRNTYVPLIGLFYLAGEFFSRLYFSQPRPGAAVAAPARRSALALAAVVLTVVLSALSYKRAAVWKDSMTLWDDAVKNYPSSPAPAYNNRGDAYNRAGDPEKAIENYTKAVESDPSFADAYFNRGNALQSSGELPRALADYNEAIRLEPKNPKAYVNRANVFASNGSKDLALADLDTALRLNPRFAEAYYNRGVYELERKEREKALSDFTEAIRSDPSFARAYFKRSDIYGSAGDYDRALSDLEKAVALEPRNPDYLYTRAVAYYMKKEYNKAREDIRKLQGTGYGINPQFLKLLEGK